MTYAREMAARMPAAMPLPEEFLALFDWIEANGFFMANGPDPDNRVGLIASREDYGEGRATTIEFNVATPDEASEFARYWLDAVVPNVETRLVPFALSSADGSHVALWRDDDGQTRIVHLGSEGHAFVISPTPLDFLRYLAIGYYEASDCALGPDEPPDEPGRNVAFRAWLIGRYGVTIPETAAEIMGDIPDMFAETSDDPFWLWTRAVRTTS